MRTRFFEGFDSYLRVDVIDTPVGKRATVSKYIDRKKRNVFRVHTTVENACKIVHSFLVREGRVARA